jgi:hypothetical protein
MWAFGVRRLLIWPSSFRGEDFKKLANQKQELPVEGHVW